MTSKLIDRQSFFISLAIFASFFAVILFDPFDREKRGGILLTYFLLMYVPSVLGFASLRFLWGFFCKKMHWPLYCLDVVPYVCFITFIAFYEPSCLIYLALPLIVFVVEFATYHNSQKIIIRSFLFIVETLAYLLCGLYLFYGMNLTENLVYVFIHYQTYLFPLLLFRALSVKKLDPLVGLGVSAFLPILIVVFFKLLYGRISQLDLLFCAILVVVGFIELALKKSKKVT